MKLLENPTVYERELPEEGKYIEVEWEFEETPTEEWEKKFWNLIKPFLEKQNELFGPYKPKIFSSIFITTILDKNLIEKQKKFYEEEFFNKI